MKQVGRGAEAILYQSTFKGKKAVLKKRVEKKYRHPSLDKKLRKGRTRREERVLQRLEEKGINAPRLLDAKDATIYFTLEKGITAKNAKLTPAILKNIAIELAKMNDAGVAHGDFTTSNILVNGSKAIIIDFGLSTFTQDPEDYATDLLLFEKTVSAGEFAAFVKAYAKAKKNSAEVIEKLHEIKQRGRYVER